MMDFYTLNFGNFKRRLPIVALTSKIKIASINFLGDKEMVNYFARKLVEKIEKIDFDYLVGPEVKVVPILHELTNLLKKERYIVCRKEIHGYMVSPIKTREKQGLVIDGTDAKVVKNKKVIILDDVVSSGKTLKEITELMNSCGAEVVAYVSAFRQKLSLPEDLKDLIYIGTLPVFTS